MLLSRFAGTRVLIVVSIVYQLDLT